jgi:hypothetical protein
VNDLCIDKQGECIASCSDDGTVVLNGLYSAECESFTYQRPVKVRASSVCKYGCVGVGSESFMNARAVYIRPMRERYTSEAREGLSNVVCV